MSLIEKIKSRGYWDVAIRPTTFASDRLAFNTLEQVVESSRVEIRGWDFPHISRHEAIHRDVDFVGQETQWEHHLEAWRFHQSGLFVDLSCIPADWRDESQWWAADKGWSPGRELGIGDTLFRFTEVFDFAAGLALRMPGEDGIHIEIAVHGLQDRVLVMDDPRRFLSPYESKASLSSFPQRWEVARAELSERARDLALDAAEQLFQRFGRELPRRSLADWQAERLR